MQSRTHNAKLNHVGKAKDLVQYIQYPTNLQKQTLPNVIQVNGLAQSNAKQLNVCSQERSLSQINQNSGAGHHHSPG